MALSNGARRWPLALMLVGAGFVATGCTADDLPRFGWPSGVTEQAKELQHFWSWVALAALVVGVLMWGLMFWSFIVYRKRKNSPLYPKQTAENLPLELVYTAVPLLMISTLFYFTVTTEDKVLELTEPDVVVNVVAQKWTWDFSYEGTEVPDAVETAAPGGDRLVHTIGLADEVPILVLPVDKNIHYVLSSRDVVHSFWVPQFLFKRDAFPDPEANSSQNVIQTTMIETGAFVGRCAELCGTYHSAMNFEVRSVPWDVYQGYLGYRQQINPETGASYTMYDALKKVGEDFPECGELCSPTATTTYPLDPDRLVRAESTPIAGG